MLITQMTHGAWKGPLTIPITGSFEVEADGLDDPSRKSARKKLPVFL